MEAHSEDEATTPQEDFLFAARLGDVDTMKALLEREGRTSSATEGSKEGAGKIDVDAQDEMSGATALHYAAANGHVSVIEYLLKEISPPAKFLQNTSGNTALHWAVQKRKWEVARSLLQLVPPKPDDVKAVYDRDFVIDVLLANEFKRSALSEMMATDLQDDDTLGIEVLHLILEHPSAAALEK